MFRLIADQVVRDSGREHGVVLSPVQVHGELPGAMDTLTRGPSPTIADLALLQMTAACIDVSRVTFEDILSFRRENAHLRRHCIRVLRERAAVLASLEPGEAHNDVLAIEAEIAEMSRQLNTSLREAFGRSAVDLTLGVAGAATDVATGNPAGAVVTVLQTLRSLRSHDLGPDAYSYVFRARRRLE